MCSVVRIRSTCLEQQLFEALMLELDANLLLALALGHRCGTELGGTPSSVVGMRHNMKMQAPAFAWPMCSSIHWSGSSDAWSR